MQYNYDWHSTNTPLSAWVNKQIENRHTKAVDFKGTKNSVEELPTQRKNFMSEDEIPKVGDLWLVKDDGSDIFNEYICTSIDNDEFVWELIGNLTNFELNETFHTKGESDAKFASKVNGRYVSNGSVTIHMTDIPDHSDYALSTVVDELVNATEQTLNSEIQSKFQNVSERIESVKDELEFYSDANDKNLSALLRDRYEGRDNILSSAIDNIIKELEVELTYQGFTENVLIDSSPDPDWKIGDVRLVSSIFETRIDDSTTLTPSVDVYVWTGEPNEVDLNARGWKLIGPIQGNRLSALFATKDYVNSKNEVVLTTLKDDMQGKLNSAVEGLEDTIHQKITGISGTVANDYVTYPYLNGSYYNKIVSLVEKEISENVESVLKFKGIYNSFNEMKEELMESGSRVIGSVYLIPTTIDGTRYYEEYVVRKTDYDNDDFELIGTVDINQMSKYLLKSEAEGIYETILNCNWIRDGLAKAEEDIVNISGELSTLSTNFENLNTRYNALEYTYSKLSSHIGRTTQYWSNLPDLPNGSLTNHVMSGFTADAMSDKLNLYRFDQSFTIISSDFTNQSQDPRYHLPPATILPLGASVSYQVRNESAGPRELTISIEKENAAELKVIPITIPGSTEKKVMLCEFKVVFNGTENEWLLESKEIKNFN